MQPNYRSNRMVRSFATDVPSTSSTASKGGGGAGFFQRLSSFLVGAGLTALGTQYYLYDEIKQSNTGMIQAQKEIEKRITALEKNGNKK
jgi:hypothetical protein